MAAPTYAVVVPGTVAKVLANGKMYVTIERPEDPANPLQVQADHLAQTPGQPIHLKLNVSPKYVVAEVGDPGAFGDPTGLDLPEPVARQYQAQAAAPVALNLPTVAPMGHGYEGAPPPDNYVPNPEYAEDFDSYVKMADAGIQTLVLLKGEAGVGKTSAAVAECYRRGRIPFLLEGGRIYQPEDWFGQTGLNEQGTFFQVDPSVAAIEADSPTLIIDEINRVNNPRALNPMTGLLSALKTAYCHPLGRHIKLGPNPLIFATMNEGQEYTGTIQLDQAILSRFVYTLTMDYMPRRQEVRALIDTTKVDLPTASSIVEFAWKLRELARAGVLPTAPSTRTLVAVGNLITFGGMAPPRAIEKTMLPVYESKLDEGAAKEVATNTWESMFAGKAEKAIAPTASYAQ